MPFPTSNREVTKGMYTPDRIEILKQRQVQMTTAGYLTESAYGKDSYQSTGIELPCFTYLATGRFLSTQVTPKEYGVGDTKDYLMAIINTRNVSPEIVSAFKVDAVVKIHRKGYTLEEDGKLYRIVTGNPYPDHIEIRLVPVFD